MKIHFFPPLTWQQLCVSSLQQQCVAWKALSCCWVTAEWWRSSDVYSLAAAPQPPDEEVPTLLVPWWLKVSSPAVVGNLLDHSKGVSCKQLFNCHLVRRPKTRESRGLTRYVDNLLRGRIYLRSGTLALVLLPSQHALEVSYESFCILSVKNSWRWEAGTRFVRNIIQQGKSNSWRHLSAPLWGFPRGLERQGWEAWRAYCKGRLLASLPASRQRHGGSLCNHCVVPSRGELRTPQGHVLSLLMKRFIEMWKAAQDLLFCEVYF